LAQKTETTRRFRKHADAERPFKREKEAMAIREQVQAVLGNLPGAEKKVAHAFLANYPSIGLSTIAELATLAGASAPTVSALRRAARL
jgi:hypothetical protein